MSDAMLGYDGRDAESLGIILTTSVDGAEITISIGNERAVISGANAKKLAEILTGYVAEMGEMADFMVRNRRETA